jgi:hypothetical protein
MQNINEGGLPLRNCLLDAMKGMGHMGELAQATMAEDASSFKHKKTETCRG